jgi:hypothetical protein
LSKIIKDMEDDTKRIEERANILSKKKAEEEREKAERERRAQSDWRKQDEDKRMSTQSPFS